MDDINDHLTKNDGEEEESIDMAQWAALSDIEEVYEEEEFKFEPKTGDCLE